MTSRHHRCAQVELHVIQPTPEFANCRDELLHVLQAVVTSLQKQRVRQGAQLFS